MQFFRIVMQNNGHFLELRVDEKTVSPLSIGNKPGCDVSLSELCTSDPFEFAVYRSGDSWLLSSGGDLQFVSMGYRPLSDNRRCALENGLNVALETAGNRTQLLQLSVEVCFSYAGAKFDRRIHLGNANTIRIGGGSNCMVRLGSPEAAQEEVLLSNRGSGWYLEKLRGQHNIYLNTTLVTGPVQIRDGAFFTVADVRFYFHKESLYVDSAQRINCSGLSDNIISQQTSAMEYPVFIRSTRVQHQIETDEIEVLQPKNKSNPEKENFILKLLPPLTMIVAMVVLRGMMGGSGGMFILYSVVSMGMSLVVTIFSRKDSDKRELEKERERKERYYQYVQKKIDEIKRRRQDELRILDRIYRSSEDNIAIVRNFEKGLFDRASEDIDFLDIRLGRGLREAAIKVKTNVPEYREADDELMDMALTVVEQYRMLEDAPVVARLNKSNGIGMVGQRKWMYEMLKTMTVDLIVRQYYKEVKVYYVIDEEDQERFAWARWLRNCFDSSVSTFRNIICDAESCKVHLEALYKVLSERETLVGDKTIDWAEHYVVFAYRVDMIRNHPISQYFERCAALGMHFVFMDEHEERIPRGCSQMIRLDRTPGSGSLIYTMDGEKPYHFEYSQITEERMYEIVRKLCKVHVVEANLANEMVKNISLYELLGIKRAQELNLGSLWAKSKVEKSMSVPLGVRTKNTVQNLDLHEKAHGPHGLVAGTTGSGKSEILQSYLINMAIFFHPYEVNFLLIDFKGGGMANQFIGLPHLAGMITDIDGREIERSLKSIRAELERRKKYFAHVNVNKIDDYIQMYKKDAKSVPAPLPHLIIVVDEFAELKAEQPEFMKELISTARVGRSLGVHLILATQKPSGVVDAQIWSNSKFKLCLKVQTREDSQEMIKTPMAAEIREPGRAYLQVGNNELFELFQSAYSGAKVPDANPNAIKPFAINELNMWGKPSLVYEVQPPKLDDGTVKKPETQLDALVKYIDRYCEEAGIEPLPSICLQPLAQEILLEELAPVERDNDNDIVVAAALYDDPAQQYQGNYYFNLTKENIYMVGIAQIGKTTALQTILYAAVTQYTPEQVNFYIIDAGNMAMKVFEKSKHVGGVVVLSEEDRISNLFKLLTGMIQTRKNTFMANGVGTYAAYLESGKKDMPMVVLVIDNVAAFREYYEQYDDTLQTLAREGLSVGLSMIVTGSASNNLNYRTSSNFSCKLCFTCNDTGEYSNMLMARRMEPYNYPGRCLAVLDKQVVEAQFALPVKAESEREQQELMKARFEEDAKRYFRGAEKIPEVPKDYIQSEVAVEKPELFKTAYRMVLGMDYNQVEPVFVQLDALNSLVISGRAKSNCHRVAHNILHQIQRNVFVHNSEVYVMDDAKRVLSDVQRLGCVTEYTTDFDRMKEIIGEVYEEAQQRQERLYDTDDDAERRAMLDKLPLKLLVINNERVIKKLLSDKHCASELNELLVAYGDTKVCVIWSGYANARASGISSTEVERYVHSLSSFVFMDHLSNLKMEDVSLSTQRALNRPYTDDDAFVHLNDTYQHIKIMVAK